MAPVIKFVLAALCVLTVSPVLSAPIAVGAAHEVAQRQLHGEGVACDAILTDTDNGVGYGIENAEDNTATLVGSSGQHTPNTNGAGGHPTGSVSRQLHGEGVACDAAFTDTDNGVGYGIENAEDNTANLITSTKGGPPALVRRQMDKIANGFGNVANAVGAPVVGDAVVKNGDTVDGQLTDDAANDGTAVGGMEETTLEQVGSDVP